MDIKDKIQRAIKSKKVIIGYRKSIKFIKMYSPEIIVIAKNIPQNSRKNIEYNAKVGNIKLEIFDGSSKELGLNCGKPFPVSALVIKS